MPSKGKKLANLGDVECQTKEKPANLGNVECQAKEMLANLCYVECQTKEKFHPQALGLFASM
jgi:hypothetical protein